MRQVAEFGRLVNRFKSLEFRRVDAHSIVEAIVVDNLITVR